jgi:hypothetical protein
MPRSSIDELLQYIDDTYREIVDRPRMYAATPESLEEKLITLEDVREFAITCERIGSMRSGYFNFLMSEGFGVAIFTSSEQFAQRTDIADAFAAVADLWGRFLNSTFRVSEGESLAAYRSRCEPKIF